MKTNRTWIFIGLSSLALLFVLGIQVNWIFQSARLKEELFNEKANMVLSRTTEALQQDQPTCGKIVDCVGSANELPGTPTQLGSAEVQKIDSLFQHFLRLYNFHIEYSFVVARPKGTGLVSGFQTAGNTYKQQLLNGNALNGVELKLIFPDKKDYLLAEMGIPFFSSVALIVVVLVLFWKTVHSLLKEKEISEHTTAFLNNMTHEFKTPLTNIALAGKMMIREPNLHQEDKIRLYSGIILEENEKLHNQVEQVLSMTALERGEIPLQKTELDLHQILSSAVHCLMLQIEAGNGKLKLDLNAKNHLALGDAIHLTHAFCNLIDNALKYSKGNPDLHIQTSNLGNEWELQVKDRGIGIEKKYHKKVFDQFFRVPTGDVHDVKGFGLGLAYVKKIIDMHGGRIAVKSEKGIGTIFTISLPNV